MNRPLRKHGALERLLAVVLRYGTWLASAVIALGLAIGFASGRSGAGGAALASTGDLVTLGIALFILLPVLRVTIMAIVFALERDYLFMGIATLVLLIIGLGVALGVSRAAPAGAEPTPHTAATAGQSPEGQR